MNTNYATPVKAVDASGNVIRRFPSQCAAARAFGCFQSKVWSSLTTGRPVSGVWFQPDGESDRPYVPQRGPGRSPAVEVTVNGRVYPSINKARVAAGVSYDTMWRRVRGRSELYTGRAQQVHNPAPAPRILGVGEANSVQAAADIGSLPHGNRLPLSENRGPKACREVTSPSPTPTRRGAALPSDASRAIKPGPCPTPDNPVAGNARARRRDSASAGTTKTPRRGKPVVMGVGLPAKNRDPITPDEWERGRFERARRINPSLTWDEWKELTTRKPYEWRNDADVSAVA